MEQKLHLSLYTFSQEDYKQAALIWNGPHPDDGQERFVVEGGMEGYPAPDLEEEPQLNKLIAQVYRGYFIVTHRSNAGGLLAPVARTR